MTRIRAGKLGQKEKFLEKLKHVKLREGGSKESKLPPKSGRPLPANGKEEILLLWQHPPEITKAFGISLTGQPINLIESSD